MASVNRVFIMGNLGADPELRQTANQFSVATLNVATKEFKGGGQGAERQEFTEWHRVVVWGRQAENCSKFLSKGRPVFIEGRLQTRSWDDKNGVKRYTTEIVANNVQFLGSSTGATRTNENQNQFGGAPQSEGQSDFAKFDAGSANSSPANDVSFGGPNTPSLDDIPF